MSPLEFEITRVDCILDGHVRKGHRTLIKVSLSMLHTLDLVRNMALYTWDLCLRNFYSFQDNDLKHAAK